MSNKRDRHGQPYYGQLHKRTRKRFARRMEAGEVFYCWRPTCPTPDVPINPRCWDLGHVDPELHDQFGTRWPECRKCNRGTLPRMLAEARGDGRPDPTKDAMTASRDW
jgi:hypothetical protein